MAPLIFCMSLILGVSYSWVIKPLVCSNNTIIQPDKICDGYPDCLDGADELTELCQQSSCRQTEFQCTTGECIPFDNLCDGVSHCKDFSDEFGEECDVNKKKLSTEHGSMSFKCGTEESIPSAKQCDGEIDCIDGSDESPRLCAHNSCGKDSFRCSYGACVSKNVTCDQKADCADWSDESLDACLTLSVLPPGACQIPKPPNSYTAFHIPGCISCETGSYIKPGKFLQAKCKEGFLATNIEMAQCIRSKWSPALPYCIPDNLNITCPPILGNAYLKCEKKISEDKTGRLKNVDCEKPVEVGTLAQIECPQFYKQHGHNTTECLFDGTWSSKTECVPECGLVDGVTPLITGGSTGSWPWVAALYSKESATWNFICGATLISNRILLTGHCVWDVEIENIRISLGNTYRNFFQRESSKQIFKVAKVKVPPVYQDRNGNYGSDIAILYLETEVMLSSAVQPACVAWNTSQTDTQLTDGMYGIVAGWGLNQDMTPSEVQQFARLPVIQSERCIDKAPRDFKKYVTHTSFCAGYLNGTSVCNGDSGSGYLTEENGIWYLQGVVSISPRKRGTSFCDPNLYALFTKVSSYNAWLHRTIESLENKVSIN